MTGVGSEELLLRSVALQTADTIFRARARAEDALREQTEWLRITLASIGDAVISTDGGGRVTFLNGVAEALTGWPQDEARGRPLADVFRIFDEATGRPVEDPAMRALREGRVVAPANHTTLVARDGTERPIDDNAAPMRDASGAPVGAVLVFRDVTDRQRADRARARDALLLANVRDAVVVTDLEGVITYWNEGATRLFGWAAREMLGRPPDGRFPGPPGGATATEWSGESEVLCKDGSRLWIGARASPVTDEAGRVIGVLRLAHDITDRKRAEEALRDSDRRKGQFIALLAHELRNPLAPIRNGLQVMRLAGDDPVAVAQARAVMERHLGHMVRLIDDLLDISRINQDRMELRRARVLLADVVATAVETARPIIEAAGHDLTVSLPTTPVFLDADLTRLAQVLSNLLTNSAKYTDRGGRIWLAADRRRDEVAFTVRDTGIGIPPEALPRVFDMFAQVARAVDRAGGGLGIGLSLVKGLVEMHGGTVTAESDGPGAGSTFTVRLPAPGPIDEPEAPGPQRGGRGQARAGRRILVVDDNEDSARTMARVLKLLGHEVRVAHDGVDAVEEAEAFRPEAILMDLGMPRMDGHEATRRIRERDWGHAPVIVALTGWGQEADRAQSREAGCDGHLVKPVDLPDLERLLDQLLAARAANPPA